MIKLSRLREVADETLGGLTADSALFHRAKMKVGRDHATAPRPVFTRALAYALSFMFLLGIGASALMIFKKPGIPTLDSMPAGELQEGAQQSASGNLPRGSLTLSNDRADTEGGVWAQGKGPNFPLLRVDGRFYRLLDRPFDVSALTGQSLGKVAINTPEPALDTGSGILSNVVAAGETVYAIPSMQNAVIAAKVGSETRAFQRVAFSSAAVVGSETLGDTLPQGAVAMTLTDLGTVSDPGTVNHLVETLLSKAAYQGSQLLSGKQILLIQYQNGLVLQMAVSGNNVSAAGTWACPDFFEEFSKAAK